jgi:predicted  nucleic acid-binding Zn-ribbon protein
MMYQISGGNVLSGGYVQSQKDDTYTENIQKQIEEAQVELREVSSDEKMGMEEKMKKRNELQEEIFQLKSQLSHRQMSIERREQRKASGVAQVEDGRRKSVHSKVSTYGAEQYTANSAYEESKSIRIYTRMGGFDSTQFTLLGSGIDARA